MKHLKKFETFSINEEFLGIGEISEIKKKILDWFDENEGNQKLQIAIDRAVSEFDNMDTADIKKLERLPKEQSIKESLLTESEDLRQSGESDDSWTRRLITRFFFGLNCLSIPTSFFGSVVSIVGLVSNGIGLSIGGALVMSVALIPTIIAYLYNRWRRKKEEAQGNVYVNNGDAFAVGTGYYKKNEAAKVEKTSKKDEIEDFIGKNKKNKSSYEMYKLLRDEGYTEANLKDYFYDNHKK